MEEVLTQILNKVCASQGQGYPIYMWGPNPNGDNIFKINYGHPLFFLRLASSDRPKFWAFKKKRNYVVKPFFTWNNCFNLKNEHTNSIEKNRNKNRNICQGILCILLIQQGRSQDFSKGGSQRLLTRLYMVYTAALPHVSAGSVVLSRHEGPC